MTLDERTRRYGWYAIGAVVAILIIAMLLGCASTANAPLGPGLGAAAGGAIAIATGIMIGGLGGLAAGATLLGGTLWAAARGIFGSAPTPYIAPQGSVAPWYLTFGGIAQAALALWLVYFLASLVLSPRYREQIVAFLKGLFTGRLPTATKHVLAATGRMHTSKKTGAPVRRISPRPVSRRPR